MSENISAPQKKKTILSGIQPTGVFTLGNYLGAVKNWAKLQDDYNCAYMIANMHAITVRQDATKLRAQTLDAFALLLACGVDPEKSLCFIQSHNKCHAELSWVLNCYCQFGELSRMTQFKDKSQKNADNINAGLFTYPVLMASDILLYKADLVPVGADQKQHLELTRDIANRFNQLYGNVFTVPEPYIEKQTAKIMSLAEPSKKMSKSDANAKATIFILDSADTIIKKFKSAVTDSGSEIVARDDKEGITNLMTIYSAVTDKSFAEIEREFEGKGYGDFKLAVGEAVADHLKPVRENFEKLRADKAYLESVYKAGGEKATAIASRVLEKVYHKVGFVK